MAFLTRLSGWTVGLPSICYKVFRSTAVRPPQRRSYSPLPRYAARPYMIEGNSPPSAQPAWLLPAHPNPEPLFPNIEHLVPGEAVFLQGLDSRLAARAYQVNRALASRHICFQLRALSVNLRDTDKFDRYLWNVILQMTWKPTQLQHYIPLCQAHQIFTVEISRPQHLPCLQSHQSLYVSDSRTNRWHDSEPTIG